MKENTNLSDTDQPDTSEWGLAPAYAESEIEDNPDSEIEGTRGVVEERGVGEAPHPAAYWANADGFNPEVDRIVLPLVLNDPNYKSFRWAGPETVRYTVNLPACRGSITFTVFEAKLFRYNHPQHEYQYQLGFDYENGGPELIRNARHQGGHIHFQFHFRDRQLGRLRALFLRNNFFRYRKHNTSSGPLNFAWRGAPTPQESYEQAFTVEIVLPSRFLVQKFE